MVFLSSGGSSGPTSDFVFQSKFRTEHINIEVHPRMIGHLTSEMIWLLGDLDALRLL